MHVKFELCNQNNKRLSCFTTRTKNLRLCKGIIRRKIIELTGDVLKRPLWPRDVRKSPTRCNAAEIRTQFTTKYAKLRDETKRADFPSRK